MIDCVYYNDDIRCYRDGRVERYWKQYLKIWKIVENIANKGDHYNYIKINKKYISRHRLLAFCFLGLKNIVGTKRADDDVIDHIDRNPLNNDVDNLRITSPLGNQQNRSNCKGYSWDIINNKWKVYIGVNGKQKYIGRYTTAEEAHQAYLDAKKIYHII